MELCLVSGVGAAAHVLPVDRQHAGRDDDQHAEQRAAIRKLAEHQPTQQRRPLDAQGGMNALLGSLASAAFGPVGSLAYGGLTGNSTGGIFGAGTSAVGGAIANALGFGAGSAADASNNAQGALSAHSHQITEQHSCANLASSG